MYFNSRQDAGRILGEKLPINRGDNLVVVAIPQGGVATGAALASRLHAPLGIVIVSKICHPLAPGLTIGAIAEDDPPVYDSSVAGITHMWWREMSESAARTRTHRRRTSYGNVYVEPALQDKIVVIADDGMISGLTMLAAAQHVLRQHPQRVVIAVPVASIHGIAVLKNRVTDLAVLEDPRHFLGTLRAHYRLFEPVTDDTVKRLLSDASQRTSEAARTQTVPEEQSTPSHWPPFFARPKHSS